MKQRRLVALIAAAAVGIAGFGMAAGSPDQASAKMPKLTGPDAKGYIKKALHRRDSFNYRWGYAKRIKGCKRYSRTRIRCKTSWNFGDLSYKGPVTIWYRQTKRGPTWNFAYRIKRTNWYCLNQGGSRSKCTKTFVVT
jgi:hypothetical protein